MLMLIGMLVFMQLVSGAELLHIVVLVSSRA
jgi:hypothetical protein